MSKYAIGIDFGTLSARAVLVNLSSGEEIADATKEYTHGVMDKELPSGKKLPPMLLFSIRMIMLKPFL